MSSKKFNFDDEDNHFHHQNNTQSQIDSYEDERRHIEDACQNTETKQNQDGFQTYQKSYSRQRPKTKVKKKTKRKTKTKHKTKVIKQKRKRSWFSQFILFLISLMIIAGMCVGGYIAYRYYIQQEHRIEDLEKQVQENKNNQPSLPQDDSQNKTPETPEEEPEENQEPQENQEEPSVPLS